ncbi:MAG: pyruvate, phosphate dikinase [Acidobacteria bacterium]|nr:pyruvate, phosphate dikinase [Acidobacteriota bacterium]
MTSGKNVYFFGGGSAEGNVSMKDLLGGKGAGLAEMAGLGLPVPPGFTITTEVCTYFDTHGGAYPDGLKEEVSAALARVEELTGKKFGDATNPLLVSVRSGARVSMPGMMDTVLNLGLNDTTIQGLVAQTSNPRFAYDCYRRFVAMYGDVVLGVRAEGKDDVDPFELELDRLKKERGADYDTDLDAAALAELVTRFKAVIRARTGADFPEDPEDQLWGAIAAVFGSWDNERAIAYREINGIPGDWGTAVNIVAMVYGNMGEDSGTGVAFTRNPATGENRFYGEFLVNAQGEDVVAGIRTPLPIEKIKDVFHEVWDQLLEARKILEDHFRDMQDIEFTVERGKLWLLQTRTAKRTGLAAIRIAVDMVDEGRIEPAEALRRVEPEQLNQLLRPIFDPEELARAKAEKRVVAKGLPAGPGAATGRVVFNAPDAVDKARAGEPVILVRLETSPEDIKGMAAADGILTARGGMTSHAALVARQMGKTCVAGCEDLVIDYVARTATSGGTVIREGDWISLDGFTGEVITGQVATRPSEVIQVLIEKSLDPSASETYPYYEKLLGWADEIRVLGVHANADQPDQAANAVAFGAEGIGLCRTEHMFFGGERIVAVREMILAENIEERERALAKLEPMQEEDFAGLFRVMDGRPVIIRTLDPPLHEFLPHSEEEAQTVASQMGVPVEKILAKAAELKEFNPMLGHRGCRLGVVFPEITRMQARAILTAACKVAKEGIRVEPEIMIPLVSLKAELEDQEAVVRSVAGEVFDAEGIEVAYKLGTMIELPRAALMAGQIAEVAEFFSFGTNDLTQTTFGLSRDDSGRFLPQYVDRGFIAADPFASLDTEGVGQLVAMGTERGRKTRPGIQVGICGEHGGDPASIGFCHRTGLDYVSCSPFRIPIARLAAARAQLESPRER